MAANRGFAPANTQEEYSGLASPTESEASSVTCPFRCFAVALLPVLALPGMANAEEDPPSLPAEFDVELELKASDLDAITMEILRQQPLLASSPGIKVADGYRQYPAGELAQVIFFPHTETGGVKQAFQASCNRADSDSAWSCPVVQVRRYVKLDSQDFEVRVRGDIDINGVLAITEATRRLAASAVQGASTADTAIIVSGIKGRYLVSWGSKAGYPAVVLKAQLRVGGNPASPGDWDAAVVPSE